MEITAGPVPALWREITILLAVVAFAAAAFRRFNWNPILGLVASGAGIGPHGSGLIENGGGVELLGDVGILFLLFAVGMDLSPDRLRSMARWIVGLGFLHMALSAAGIAALAHYGFGTSWNTSAVIGVAGSMSSTAFVLQLLSERRELTLRFGQKTFSVLLFQDLSVRPRSCLGLAEPS